MSEITYDMLKGTDAFSKLPILTLDPRWYQLVPAVSKTDEIKYWEQQVNNLLKRQAQINNDIKDIKKIKGQLIQAVVNNMEEDFESHKRKKLMSQNQRLIQEAKQKISSLEEEEIELPKELARANQMLLVETAKLCYSRINENKNDIEVLDKWIEATRIKLKKNLLVKQDKEAANEQLYAGMHDILGAKVMMALDRVNDLDE